MDNTDLTTSMQELMAEMASMRVELANLKERANVIVPPAQTVKPVVTTTRRKALQRLAGVMVAGMAVGTGSAALPGSVEAKLISNAGTRIATIITSNGSTVTGDLPTGGSFKYGLLAYNGNGTNLDTTNPVGFEDGGAAIYARGNSTYALVAYSNYVGILARSTSNTAITGLSAYTTAITGISQSGSGIYGSSVNGSGLEGASSNASGVYGHTSSASSSGVEGYASNSNGVYGNGSTGVKGSGSAFGIYGESTSGKGVYGTSSSSAGVNGYSGSNFGVSGASVTGSGVYAESTGAALSGPALQAQALAGNGIAAYFLSNSTDTCLVIDNKSGTGHLFKAFVNGADRFIVTAAGNVLAHGTFFANGVDLAEVIPVTDHLEPGDVVEIDPENPGFFRRCAAAGSLAVAGVISTRPGMLLGSEIAAEGEKQGPQLALAGRIPVKATPEGGPIRPGDLLVAASTPGYAMRAPLHPEQGSVLGKALGRLESDTGMVDMLVMLR